MGEQLIDPGIQQAVIGLTGIRKLTASAKENDGAKKALEETKVIVKPDELLQRFPELASLRAVLYLPRYHHLVTAKDPSFNHEDLKARALMLLGYDPEHDSRVLANNYVSGDSFILEGITYIKFDAGPNFYGRSHIQRLTDEGYVLLGPAFEQLPF